MLGAIVLITVVVSIVMARASNHSALYSGALGGLLAPLALAVVVAMAVVVTRLQRPFPSSSSSRPPAAPRDEVMAVAVLVLNFDPILPQRDGRRLHQALG